MWHAYPPGVRLAEYTPRDPSAAVLYTVVRDHFETFRVESARHSYVECRVASTLVNGPDGKPAQLTFGDPGYIDYFGRPWAQNWDEHFENGWEKPVFWPG